MSDENSSDGNSGVNDGDAGQAPQYVTQESFTEQFKSLQDGLFSMVRKMNQSPESPKQPAPQQKSEPAKPDQQLADMQARIDFLEQASRTYQQLGDERRSRQQGQRWRR
mgnify:CR=1 FL=1